MMRTHKPAVYIAFVFMIIALLLLHSKSNAQATQGFHHGPNPKYHESYLDTCTGLWRWHIPDINARIEKMTYDTSQTWYYGYMKNGKRVWLWKIGSDTMFLDTAQIHHIVFLKRK